MLQNGNFSEGWETLAPIIEAGNLRNQRPLGWQVEWLAMGANLYDDPNNQAKGIPECVHKLSKQLPQDERLGGKSALILDGDAVYKVFSANAPFGVTLSQTVSGLQPGSEATLIVPIQVHLHGETDAFGAESSVWVDGVGGWINGFDMGDRKWCEHKREFTVAANGQAEIVIRVKSKWRSPKDFFFDGITLDAQPATDPVPVVDPPPVVDDPPPVFDDPPPIDVGETKTVFIQVPVGVQIKQGVCDEAHVVEVNAGPGVKIELV